MYKHNAYPTPPPHIKNLTLCSEPLMVYLCSDQHTPFLKTFISFTNGESSNLPCLTGEISWNALMYVPRKAFGTKSLFTKKTFYLFLFCVKKGRFSELFSSCTQSYNFNAFHIHAENLQSRKNESNINFSKSGFLFT